MKKEKELKIVNTMIWIYCKHHHGQKKKVLCSECMSLYEFVKLRRDKCPFGDEKGFCANCRIHCYKSNIIKREQIRAVMRYSGPRLMFTHPLMCFSHLKETIKKKRENKKEERINNDR